MNNNSIFKKGSKTFYTASLFFPEEIRKNVVKLYAFVRTADDFVDKIPQDKKGFLHFKKQTTDAYKNKPINNTIITDFIELCHECNIEKKWVEAFLSAMEQDLQKRKYITYKELEEYMYGSAEVIGLMMARIMNLPKKAEHAASEQGKALQLINFIRDIQEDRELGRQYIPDNDLHKFGINSLSSSVDETKFNRLIAFQIDRYKKLQTSARKGYKYIPRKNRIPVATAAALYDWTANEIHKNPMIVFKTKIKPSRMRIFREYMKQTVTL